MTDLLKDLTDIYYDFKRFVAKGLRWDPDWWIDGVPVPVLIQLGRFYY